jgi:hypothetical protein
LADIETADGLRNRPACVGTRASSASRRSLRTARHDVLRARRRAAQLHRPAVLRPDGSQLQRVGLIPDVRVAPTLRGVRAGDDELLAAGVHEALRLSGADAKTTQTALAAERASERADAAAQGGP